jgi:hypothetical protein
MQTWWNLFVSWVPFIVFLVVWLYFMKKTRAPRQRELIERSFVHMERSFAYMDHVEALLERIAANLEKQRSA